ncbi:MAG: sulfatase-like hydrolase/transferase [Planctomycetota bacterium]|jgi:arylsulfatase A-like enzyme|nr:sulfatase-like hydrolase/transferase [Planctomycetota bacterium]
MARPNFLIIITDQFHPRCLGYAGHPVVSTPNIDRLAAEGMAFERMYTPQPLCMPARASMFTGLTPRGHRVRMNGIPLDRSIPTFTETLRQNGYHTHCCGKIHLCPSGLPHGLDPDEADPDVWSESSVLWRSGRIRELPSPFYGLESVDYANGHGHSTWGQYLHWLDQEHPDEAHYFYDRVPLETPGPAYELFNRSSYKWALPSELHPMAWIADRTIDFLDGAGRQRAQTDDAPCEPRPFCLMCSIQDPHSPFAPTAPYCNRYRAEDVPPQMFREEELDSLPPHFRQMYESPIITSGNKAQPMNLTTPHYAECAAHYYGLIEMVDDQVGRVMKALETNGLQEDTVVMFVADHGEALGDHGMWGKGPYHIDGVIRVPFIVCWPGRTKQGATFEGVTSLLDFAPTILDIAGLSIPENCPADHPEAPDAPHPWPGRSLARVLTGEDTSLESSALVEMDEDYLGFKMRTLVTRRYRLTCYSGLTCGELFDLENDPDEFQNLWDDPASRTIRDELRMQLLDKIMETDISLPRQVSRA